MSGIVTIHAGIALCNLPILTTQRTGVVHKLEQHRSRVMVPIQVYNYIAGECDYECIGGTLMVVA